MATNNLTIGQYKEHQRGMWYIHYYHIAFPDHCSDCCGHGGYMVYDDPSPHGVSLGPSSMREFNQCRSCLDRDLCPRCGHIVSDDHIHAEHLGCPCEYVFCPNCKWTDDPEMYDHMGYVNQEDNYTYLGQFSPIYKAFAHLYGFFYGDRFASKEVERAYAEFLDDDPDPSVESEPCYILDNPTNFRFGEGVYRAA